MSNPGTSSARQENVPLSSSIEPLTQTSSSHIHHHPPLHRDSSVLHAVGNFVGIGVAEQDESIAEEEKSKWNQKRLRRLASKYKLKPQEVDKFAQKSFIAGDSVDFFAGDTPVSPSPQDDLERGGSQFFDAPSEAVRRRTRIGPTPSLPAQTHYGSTSFDQPHRLDSFSSSIDQSRASKSRLTTNGDDQESLSSVLLSSAKMFFKKGSMIDKKRLRLRSTAKLKGSWAQEEPVSRESPKTPSTPETHFKYSSVAGFPEGQCFEMKEMGQDDSGKLPRSASPKRKRESPPDKQKKSIQKNEIPEETPFELEVEQMSDIDEAEVTDIDPSAIPRMKTRVRKKSSARTPVGVFPKPSGSAEKSPTSTSAVQDEKSGREITPVLDRPSSLLAGTRPLSRKSKSLPSVETIEAPTSSRSRSRSRSFKRGKSRQKQETEHDDLLLHLADVSERKDLEDGGADSRVGEGEEMVGEEETAPSSSDSEARMFANRSMSVVSEVFFDTPRHELACIHSWVYPGPVGMPAPEVDAYHPDIASSPPTSAQLARAAAYRFDPEAIQSIDDEEDDMDVRNIPSTSQSRRDKFVTNVYVGDAEISHPEKTALGKGARLQEGDAALRMVTDRPRAFSDERSAVQNLFPFRFGDVPKVQRDKLDHLMGNFSHKALIEDEAPRQRGMDLIGKFFGRQLKDNSELPEELRLKIGEGENQRVWFTYWVTTVQILVFVLSVIFYGFGPISLQEVEYESEVLDVTMTNRRVSFKEPANLYIGPSYADLIRLGAVYSPCMRRETKLWNAIEEERRIENGTGCCILKSEKNSCYQSSKTICPLTYARWVRWDQAKPTRKTPLLTKSKSESNLMDMNRPSIAMRNDMVKIRTSGAVCGQDPDYCDVPSSRGAYEWPDDITQWPICEKKRNASGLPDHMTCEVTGRPCCIQLQGLCRIATKEYCDYVKGAYHENATLCSQVDCFRSVCGLFPSYTSYPSQFYRLFMSLFIHAGFVHIVFTFFFQIFYMRDIERLIGAKRMAILYFASGVGGNLASAIFVPFYPEVGPSGTFCGLVAAMIVDVHHARELIEDVSRAYLEMGLVLGMIFVLGIFPWFDNWAHLFGSIFGLLTTIVIFPYIDFAVEDKKNNTTTRQQNPIGDASARELATGSPMSVVVLPDSPMTSVAGYSQLSNSNSPEPDPILHQAVASYFSRLTRVGTRFMSRRAFIVSVAFVFEVLLFSFLLFLFFANVQIDCQWCTYFNCIPALSKCDNQGQQLFKWLPI